jgi:hypothetical protein
MTAWPFAGSAGANADGKMGRPLAPLGSAAPSKETTHSVCYAPLGILYAQLFTDNHVSEVGMNVQRDFLLLVSLAAATVTPALGQGSA